MLDLAPSTIRYYDSQHIIPPVKKGSNGLRIFTDTNIMDLRIVECLKIAGMSVKEIQKYMVLVAQGNASLAKRLAVFQQLRQDTLQKLNQLEYTLKVINFRRLNCNPNLKVNNSAGELSPFGGLVLMAEFAAQLGLKDLFKRAVNFIPRQNAVKHDDTSILSQLLCQRIAGYSADSAANTLGLL